EPSVVECRDTHFRCVGSKLDAVVQTFDALNVAKVLPALREDKSTSESEAKQPNCDASSKTCHGSPPGKRRKVKNDQGSFLIAQNDPDPTRRIKLRATVRTTPTLLRLRFGV